MLVIGSALHAKARGEGIVQAGSKGSEQLSRRLHQYEALADFFGQRFFLYTHTMLKYATVKRLRPEVAAYVAGLVDGEGTITLTREHQNENRRLVLSISSTEAVMLAFVKDAAGAGKITRKGTYNKYHTPSFAYKITNRQALDLIKQIFPFLHSYKAERAKLALDHYVNLTPRNGRYTAQKMKARKRFEQELLKLRPQTTA